MLCRSVAVLPVGGMKSITSPAPDSVMKRVTRTAVSGRYNCFVVYVVFSGATLKCPPFSRSRRAPNTLGESKRGQQNQSIVPSVVTRAAVCRSPIRPWFSIRGYSSIGDTFRSAGTARPEHGREKADPMSHGQLRQEMSGRSCGAPRPPAGHAAGPAAACGGRRAALPWG